MKTIGIIGLGFMGSAVARAIREAQPHSEFLFLEKDTGRAEEVALWLNARDCSANPADLISASDVVVLAVKPQDLRGLALPPFGDTPVVSMLAGTTIATVERALQADRVVRIMPNLAAEIRRAVVGITFSQSVPGEVRQTIMELLAPLGTLLEVPEHHLHAITAVSGSGIAFAMKFIEAMAMGAVREGLPYRQAITAACDVASSAAALLHHTATHPGEMISRVCSPGGTTIAGVHALEEEAFTAAVMNALHAAAERSRELEG